MDKQNEMENMSTYDVMSLRGAAKDMPTFDEDDFDLIAHKNAATANTQAKARVKRDRRKVSVGRIVIMILAFVACALLYLMARGVGGLFF